jgi:hypothetical protein
MRKIFIVMSLMVFTIFACSETAVVKVASDTKSDLKLLPIESSVLFYCDFSKISDSDLAQEFMPIFDEHIEKEMGDEEFEEFKEFTGFDPQKDFKSVLVAVDKIDHRDSRPHIIIHGNFDEDRIMKYVHEKAEEEDEDISWMEKEIAGHKVYVTEKRDKNFGFTFASDEKMYLGKLDWIEDILEGKTFSSNAEVNKLNESIKYGSQFWVSVNALQIKNSKPFSQAIRNFPMSEKIAAMTLSAHADNGIKFSGEIACDSPETSELMVDMMRGALAAVKLQVYKDRDAVDAINKIKMKTKGNKVLLNGELDEAFFDKLEELRMLPWKRGIRKTI